ncbi:MAG: hypothetical protein AAF514_24220 [Verrucomicrobiota bacterium]
MNWIKPTAALLAAASLPITLPAAEKVSYTRWVSELGLASDQSGPGADPDDDGRSNLQEYLADTKPLVPDTLTLIDFDNRQLRVRDTSDRPDGVLSVLSSPDLKTWTAAPDGPLQPAAAVNGWHHLMTGKEGSNFYRLEIRLAVAPPLFPDVLAVQVLPEDGQDTFRFSVVLSSPYDTRERYADGWRILAPDGTQLGFRFLSHDHASEQPFTRSLSGVSIPEGIHEVTIQGRDQVSGWGGQRQRITLPVP